jgi:HD-GYP domain-containing protein (c-di-GMP phosphodiesterase class II)
MAFPGPLAQIVRHHHENWDGTGYPDGLRGTAIPIGARVLAIVDCYDALTSDRPYRRALSHERATAMILERRGTMYEPAIADAFFRIIDELRSIPDRGRAGTPHRRARAPQGLARPI